MRLAPTHLAGRIALGVAAAGTIAAASVVPALAKPVKHGSASPTCQLGATAVGGQLTLTGGDYTPGASYRVEFTWPDNAGVADTAAWADASGNITVSTYAYWSGTYQAGVYSTSGNGALLASCSTTV
jgi:hypothetical protein